MMNDELENDAIMATIDESIENSEKVESMLGNADAIERVGDLEKELGDVSAELMRVQKNMDDIESKKSELEDKNVRLLAEMQNIKRRCEDDVKKAHKFGASRFAKDLLEVGDSIVMGIKATSGNTSIEDVKIGLDMTKKVFEKTLNAHGIMEVGGVGENFDPESHEAVSVVSSNDVESGSVAEVLQSGWKINGRLLRPAMVMVAS